MGAEHLSDHIYSVSTNLLWTMEISIKSSWCSLPIKTCYIVNFSKNLRRFFYCPMNTLSYVLLWFISTSEERSKGCASAVKDRFRKDFIFSIIKLSPETEWYVVLTSGEKRICMISVSVLTIRPVFFFCSIYNLWYYIGSLKNYC